MKNNPLFFNIGGGKLSFAQGVEERGRTLPTNKAGLENFLSVLEKQKEIAGWNIGSISSETGGIPSLLAEAKKHGLHQRYQSVLSNITTRDIGREYALNIAKAVEPHRNLLDEDLWRQAEKYASVGRGFESVPGQLPASQALAAGQYQFSGWKQEDVFRWKYGKQPKNSLEALRTLATQPGRALAGPEFASEWNKTALQNKTIARAMTGANPWENKKTFYQDLISKAQKWGISEDVITSEITSQGGNLDSIKQGLGKVSKVEKGFLSAGSAPTSRRLTNLGAQLVKEHPWSVGIGIGLASLVAINKISSKDDDYNTIEGLPHGGQAEIMRKAMTHFGSGYQGDKKERSHSLLPVIAGAGIGVGLGWGAVERLWGYSGIASDLSKYPRLAAMRAIASKHEMTIVSPMLAKHIKSKGPIGKLAYAGIDVQENWGKHGNSKRLIYNYDTLPGSKHWIDKIPEHNVNFGNWNIGVDKLRTQEYLFFKGQGRHLPETFSAGELFESTAAWQEAGLASYKRQETFMPSVARGKLFRNPRAKSIAKEWGGYGNLIIKDTGAALSEGVWMGPSKVPAADLENMLLHPADYIVQRKIPLAAEFRTISVGGKQVYAAHRFGNSLTKKVLGKLEKHFPDLAGNIKKHHLHENVIPVSDPEVLKGLTSFTENLASKLPKGLDIAAYDIGMTAEKEFKLIEIQRSFGTIRNPLVSKRIVENITGKKIGHSKAAIIGLGILGAITGALFSGKDDSYNTIEGLEHKGVAGATRKTNTDFGSGFRYLAQEILEQSLNQYLHYSNKPFFSISSKDDNYNTIEGLRHGWYGKQRVNNTDFGSGWDALRGLTRAGEIFEEMLEGKEFKAALSGAKSVKSIGNGRFGEVFQMKSSFRGKEFQFARKVGDIGEHEVEAQRAFQDWFSPTVYGSKENMMDMELIHGETLKSNMAHNTYGFEPHERATSELLDFMKTQGWEHGDTHLGNRMLVPKNHYAIIDFGKAHRISGFDDVHNTIEGLRHTGLAGLSRKGNTDFGSGLQRLMSSIKSVFGGVEKKGWTLGVDELKSMSNTEFYSFLAKKGSITREQLKDTLQGFAERRGSVVGRPISITEIEAGEIAAGRIEKPFIKEYRLKQDIERAKLERVNGRPEDKTNPFGVGPVMIPPIKKDITQSVSVSVDKVVWNKNHLRAMKDAAKAAHRAGRRHAG